MKVRQLRSITVLAVVAAALTTTAAANAGFKFDPTGGLKPNPGELAPPPYLDPTIA
jgi:hypothetical protein